MTKGLLNKIRSALLGMLLIALSSTSVSANPRITFATLIAPESIAYKSSHLSAINFQ